MKTAILSSLLALAGPAASQLISSPSLEFLYTVNATLGARWTISPTRVVIPITGGTFAGPRLSGTVQDLGADWGVTDPRGVFHPDTRYNIRTEDGVDIYVRTDGPTQEDGRTLLRGKFEVAEGKYGWLNYVVAVGVLQRPTGDDAGKYVTIDMWHVVDGKPDTGTV